jgi:hypothetical protein
VCWDGGPQAAQGGSGSRSVVKVVVVVGAGWGVETVAALKVSAASPLEAH